MEDRIFNTKDKDSNDWILRYKRPSQKILSKAELAYRTAYSDAFRRGLLLNSEVEDVMKKRGLWGSEKEVEAQKMRDEIAKVEEQLKDPELTNEQGKLVCEKLAGLRAELISHNRMLTSVTDNTAESVANEERNQFLTSECVFDNKTGIRVYKDVENFKDRLEEQATTDSYRETVIGSLEVFMGKALPSDLTDEYAENKWLKDRGLDEVEESAAEVVEEKTA